MCTFTDLALGLGDEGAGGDDSAETFIIGSIQWFENYSQLPRICRKLIYLDVETITSKTIGNTTHRQYGISIQFNN